MSAWERSRPGAGTPPEMTIEVAGIPLGIRFAEPGTALALGTHLSHLECEPSGAQPAAAIHVFDGSDGAFEPPPAGWRGPGTPADEITRYESDRWVFLLHGAPEIVTGYDRATNVAVVGVSGVDAVPPGERDTRLRYALQLALGSAGRSMIHAAVVGERGRGVLLPGRSGSGKSTLSVACAMAGMDFCSDDYVVVDPGTRTAHALLTTVKLSRDSVRMLGLRPHVGDEESRYDDRGFIAPKALVDLRDVAPDSLRESLQIAALVLPVLDGAAEPELSSISAAAALRALAPSTVFQQPVRDPALLRAMAAIVRGVPCRALRVSPDPAANAAAVRRVLASLG